MDRAVEKLEKVGTLIKDEDVIVVWRCGLVLDATGGEKGTGIRT